MKRNLKTSPVATAACGLIALTLNANAALAVSDLTTFTVSGNEGASANTAIYSLSSTEDSSFILATTVTDGTFLDAADEGYAHLRRVAPESANNVIVGSYGAIEVADVGKVVTIDAGFRLENGANSIWTIQLDGSDVGAIGDQSYVSANSFSSGNVNSDTNLLLSTLPSVRKNGTDPATNGDRVIGPLTYTIAGADVGKELGMQMTLFDSSGSRDLYIDSISYDLAAVPEPSSAALLFVGVGGLLLRRRR